MEIIPSNKKKGEKLSYQGYLYTKQIKRPSGIRWRCVERKLGCKGAVRTKHLEEEKETSQADTSGDKPNTPPKPRPNPLPLPDPVILKEHNHEAKVEKIEAAKARAQMKMIAQSGLGKPQQIFDCCRQSLSEEARMLLPSTESCKRTIRRSMQRDKPPDDPLFLSTTIVVGNWAKTREPSSERFLLFDNGVGAKQRILVFATDKNLELLCQSKRIFMDGNFSAPPKLFREFYALHGESGNKIVPLVYILLENKNGTGIFHELFESINSACEKRNLRFMPDAIHMELNEQSREAFYAVIGIKVTIKCCFSDLLATIWEEIRDQKLVELYRDDPKFRSFCGMVVAVAFLPLNEVAAGVAVLRRPHVTHVAGINLLQYFDEKFVNGKVMDNGRILPTFPPKQWNFHHEVVQGFPNTYDYPAAWILTSREIPTDDDVPNIWTTIETLQEKQAKMSEILTSSETVSLTFKQENTDTGTTTPLISNVVGFQETVCDLCRSFLDKRIDMEEFLTECGNIVKFM